MKLGRDFADLLDCLDRHGVEFLVVGGYATSVYAMPRYTKDLDIWVRASPSNGQRIISALQEFGFGNLGLTVQDFASPDTIIQLGYEPNRVDLLTELKGLEFDPCYGRAKRFQIEPGLSIPLIAREDLLRNKRAVGRPQDLADIAAIEARPEPSFED
ncbi:MAG: hypothetical protein AMXMBFR33_72250 [Candidatus Xenobia bacterium]